ncbi:MAG TPA: NnrS family protein [Devosiaceae bacterium]|nr:NnrS family protein [Devosiaceae bacterium]
MRHFGLMERLPRSGAVPRGIDLRGPALLSYGFRPFFLLAGIFAVLDMVLWVAALSGLLSLGGDMGPIDWHAHEMLFGYGAAALCGFLLTAVPNWTGSLPVSGRPLLGLLLLWLAGRIVSLVPQWLGEIPSATIDALFLPVLALLIAREVVVGRNWQNLRVVAGILLIALLNVAFHLATLAGWDEMIVLRATVAVFVLLIGQVGGRVVPSFTRNYLARAGATRLPHPQGWLDQVTMAATLLAGIAWSAAPEGWPTALLALAAAALHAVRLAGWHGWAARKEPLLLVLHVGYGFVAIGWAGVAAAAVGLLAEPSALHLLTAGAIGLMTLAIMTRASRGHTGRPLTASTTTSISYLCLFAAAVFRPLAEMVPPAYHLLLDMSALAWIAAFALFTIEHAPILLRPSLGGRRK